MYLPRHFLSGLARLAAIAVAAILPVDAASARDFNGDGLTDVLLRDRNRGEHRLLLSLSNPGGIVRSRGMLLSADRGRSKGFDVRTGDFNGDGRSDILSRDLLSGETRIRLMDGTAILSQRTIPELPQDPATALVTVADFNGDGSDDLMYRDLTSGIWSVFIMQGLDIDLAASGATGMPERASMQWVSSADFNGDGRADVLLRNSNTLQWFLHLMNGRDSIRSSRMDALPLDPEWQLQAIADFNRDRRADLLLRHRGSGQWQMLMLDGFSILPASGIAAIAESGVFRLRRVADFNGDGYPDVLLQRPDSGRWLLQFMMERGRLPESGFVELAAPAALAIADTGDFNGDGADDVLVSDENGNWSSLTLTNPRSPVQSALGTWQAREFPLACNPPNYFQFGSQPRPPAVGEASAFLSWRTPVTRENGEALCRHELAGYRIYRFSSMPSSFSATPISDPEASSWLFDSLSPNTHYFLMMSIDAQGAFSRASELMSKIIP
jgi:hypothetical protein